MPPKAKLLDVRLSTKWKLKESTGCWEWTGCRTPFGYGKIGIPGHPSGWIHAMRAAWLAWKGDIPDGAHVCHDCDNPPCINPEHLFLGTALSNMQDMYAKNRAVRKDHRGPRNPRFGAKLTEETKRTIAKSLAITTFRITTPTGEILVFKNLKAFARENNLNVGHLSMLRRGLVKTCKGFTKLEYVI